MNERMRLTSRSSLQTFLTGVINESVKTVLGRKALEEKERQDATADDLFGDVEDDDDSKGSKTMDADVAAMKKDNVTTDDIVNKLNTIRSGKSLSDENVSKAMDEYVSSLTKTERTALLAFMKGIAQVMTGEVSGKNAVEPSKSPGDVKMTKGNEKKTKHVKPNVIKGAPKSKPKTGAEDTTGPVPITPRKK